MIEIFMPKAGMDMTEGTLIRWLKEVGDPVEKDEPVMEIETCLLYTSGLPRSCG